MNAPLPAAATVINSTPPLLADHGQWQANLDLSFVQNHRGTRLSKCQHKGPLYIQKPFYPEGADLAHVYLLHPPGGIVSGDTLSLNIDIAEGAKVLVTTPGATRFYGAREIESKTHGDGLRSALSVYQTQYQNYSVAAGACLEWLPMETIAYNRAEARVLTELELADSAAYIGWEFICFGLPASKQLFTQGSFTQRLTVKREGRPLLIDGFAIDNEKQTLLHSAAGLAGNSVLGNFVAILPANSGIDLAQLVEQCRQKISEASAESLVAISALPTFITARYLGHSANEGRALFSKLWGVVRPALVGADSCAPRIWAT